MRFTISILAALACNQAYSFFDNGFFSDASDNNFGSSWGSPSSSQSAFDSYFSRFYSMPNKFSDFNTFSSPVDNIKPVDNPFQFSQVQPTLKNQAPLKQLDLNEQKVNIVAQPATNVGKSLENIGKPLSDEELLAQKKHSEIYENLSKQLPFDDLALNIPQLPAPKIAPKQQQTSPSNPVIENRPKITEIPKVDAKPQEQIRKVTTSQPSRPQAPPSPQAPPASQNKPQPSQGGGAPPGVTYQIRPKKL